MDKVSNPPGSSASEHGFDVDMACSLAHVTCSGS
jgi:hypothetical protein